MKPHVLRRMIALALVCSLLVTLSGCDGTTRPVAGIRAETTDQGTVLVTWDASEDAMYYRLYRKDGDDQDYRYLGDIAATEYLDADVMEDTCWYRVEVIGEKGVSEGVETEPVILSLAGTEDLETETAADLTAPVITSVTRLDKYTAVIQLEDTGYDGQYEVLRSSTENGEYHPVGTADLPIYYDETAEGSIYYYAVRKVQGDRSGELSQPAAIGTNPRVVFRVPVIMYHEFVVQENLDGGVLFDEYAIWRSELEEDLIWLRDNGYTTITTAELVSYMNGEGEIPEKPIVLTIDDGKLGVYKHAYPLLQEYGMKAVLAVIGSRIDRATQNSGARAEETAPYCTWEEIGEMSDSGVIEIVSHTYGLHVFHHNERQGANVAEGESVEDYLVSARMDYAKIQNKIKDATGTTAVALAYPYSKRSVTSDLAWLACGYQILLGGDDPAERKTRSNYYIRGAGVNRNSAVARRLVRMTGTPLQYYVEDAIEYDSY